MPTINAYVSMNAMNAGHAYSHAGIYASAATGSAAKDIRRANRDANASAKRFVPEAAYILELSLAARS